MPNHDPGPPPPIDCSQCPFPNRRREDPWKEAILGDVSALRRRDDDLAERISANKAAIEANRTSIEANTIITQQVYDHTRIIIEAVENAGAMWAFLSKWGGRLGRLIKFVLKWTTLIGGSIVIVYQVAEHVANVDLAALTKKIISSK